jgi:hypothetical protein
MSTIIFLGPSLPHSQARAILPNADIRPPVACGDVVLAAQKRPKTIAIIDGFFHYQAAVWHKEILYALAQGITVYGAASMGALRAAELHQFGMHGIGKIFQWYAEGTLNDDDEVAILHHGPRADYRPVSEAMVNIRCSLQAAVQQGIINQELSQVLLEQCKRCYYPDRTLAKVLADRPEPQPPEIIQLTTWWSQHYLDQKQQDALELLQYLNDDSAQDVAPLSFDLQKTAALTKLIKLSTSSARAL